MKTPQHRQPNILFYDIETGFNVVRLFGLFGNNWISHEAIQQERYMICVAYKWAHEKKVHVISQLDDMKRFKKDPSDDTHVVKNFYKVLGKADVSVAHNGDRFDMKYVKGRALYHGLKPIPQHKQIDTLKIAKRNFNLNCNRLDYLGQYLGLGRKIHTDASLWHDCLNGKVSAVNKMIKYNKQDVRLLEDIYNTLLPWDDRGLNHNFFVNGEEPVCPHCGSVHLHRRGYQNAITRVYQRYQCTECGGWSRSVKSEKGAGVQVR